MTLSPPDDPLPTSARVFLDGMRNSATSAFSLVLIGTYVGVGALGHDYGFSLPWVMLSTVLIWAGPAQVILISALGTGAAAIEVALAVGLSSVRLMPMVVALLPLLKGPTTRDRELLLPAHFTAATMWVESLRLLPGVPRERRVAFRLPGRGRRRGAVGGCGRRAASRGRRGGRDLGGELPRWNR